MNPTDCSLDSSGTLDCVAYVTPLEYMPDLRLRYTLIGLSVRLRGEEGVTGGAGPEPFWPIGTGVTGSWGGRGWGWAPK